MKNGKKIMACIAACLLFLFLYGHEPSVYAAQDPVAEAKNCIVEIYYGITTNDGAFHRMKHASGIVISNQEDKAYVLTAYNTVSSGQKAKKKYCKEHKISTQNNSMTDTIQIVTKGDVIAAPASVITSSKDKNFCVLETGGGLAEKSSMKLGISGELITGNKVYTQGFASDAGEKDEEANRYTEFTSLDVVVNEGNVQDISSNQEGVMYLQHSAIIDSGNHGGSLLDEKGYLVGINNGKLSDKDQGVYYSLPVDEIREILDNYQIPYISIDKEYSLENFKALLEECQDLNASKEYKPKSKVMLQEAIESSKTILQTNNPKEEAIREASQRLEDGKAQLVLKMKMTRKIMIVLAAIIAFLLVWLIRLLIWRRSDSRKAYPDQSGYTSSLTDSSQAGDAGSATDPMQAGRFRKAGTNGRKKHPVRGTTGESGKDSLAAAEKISSSANHGVATGSYRRHQSGNHVDDVGFSGSPNVLEDYPTSETSAGSRGFTDSISQENITIAMPTFDQREEIAFIHLPGIKQRVVVDKECFQIGKNKDNDLVLDADTVSRKHASILWIRNHYYIKDLNSSNGTLVNGIDIPPGEIVKLGNGSRIMLADKEFIFEISKNRRKAR